MTRTGSFSPIPNHMENNMTRVKSSRRLGRIAVPALVAAAALLLAGCSSTPSTGAQKNDSKATVVVWADATRLAAFKEFQKANPKVKLKISVVDATTLLSKIQLANQAGSGWPDVIFDSTPSDVAALSGPLFKYAEPLNNLVPKSVQNGFATKNSLCTIDGKLYCLQNDLAQDVLWYNKPLLEQFGYSVPTTWAQYEALGKQVAADHPGYLLGGAGFNTVYYDYLWSSGCPLQTVINSTEVNINTKDEKCTRVASMLDTMMANGSVSRLSPVDPAFQAISRSGKLLMMPAASWWGPYEFKSATALGFAKGTLAAAPMPTWPGESTGYSGAEGGGIYVVSSHAKNLKGAVAAAQWVATNNTYQATAPTYPAYKPAAAAWLKNLDADGFYAVDPGPVLTAAADKINPAEGPTRYAIESSIDSTLVAAITSGQTITSALPALQSQLSGLAQSAGYAIK